MLVDVIVVSLKFFPLMSTYPAIFSVTSSLRTSLSCPRFLSPSDSNAFSLGANIVNPVSDLLIAFMASLFLNSKLEVDGWFFLMNSKASSLTPLHPVMHRCCCCGRWKAPEEATRQAVRRCRVNAMDVSSSPPDIHMTFIIEDQTLTPIKKRKMKYVVEKEIFDL